MLQGSLCYTVLQDLRVEGVTYSTVTHEANKKSWIYKLKNVVISQTFINNNLRNNFKVIFSNEICCRWLPKDTEISLKRRIYELTSLSTNKTYRYLKSLFSFTLHPLSPLYPSCALSLSLYLYLSLSLWTLLRQAEWEKPSLLLQVREPQTGEESGGK